MRRYGEPPRRNQRYHYRPGVYAILLRGQEVLVTHQAEPVPEFQLPGGGVDPGESLTFALAREVQEETGWSISKPRRLGAYKRFIYMPEYDKWAEKICHIFIARPAMRLGPPTEAGHTAVWMDLDSALIELSNEGDFDFLARVFSSHRF